ncbi:MAG TPA: hypothetical protein VI282_08205 [Verrucomicrobiae bacterium]
MRIKRNPLLSFALAAILTAAATQAAQLAEKIRVLSCDVASVAIQPPGAAGKDVSGALKELLEKADPDIVFLQHVADWETCERICKLRPGLRVLTCSAFENDGQVAILSRDKAALTWSAEISSGDAFALAVVQTGPKKLAVFSVQTRDTGGAAATERILAEVKKLQQFANNRPESFLIAGPSLTKSALTENSFETVASDAKADLKKACAEFWSSDAGFISRPRSITLAGFSSPILVTDIDTANTFSSKFAYQNTLLFPGESPAPVQVVLQASAVPQKTFPIWGIIAISVGALLFLVLLFRAPKKTMALARLEPSGIAAAEGELSEPMRQNLVGWLKTIFVQRLIADRRKMIADESDATRRTLAIEQKLSELQISLQDRISGYENRIARLESELSAATFENRELIRLQINDLKEKVAKAREEFVVVRN